MPGQAAPPTFAEGLKKILGDIAMLAAAPDGDPQFAMQLQQAILTKLKQPQPQGVGGQGPQASPQQQATGGLAQPQQPHMSGPTPAMTGGMRGFGGLSTTPNPDELRRLLSQNAG